jgi:hypothetical protein
VPAAYVTNQMVIHRAGQKVLFLLELLFFFKAIRTSVIVP